MVGLATYKLDAFYYLVGMLIGMFIFGEVQPLIKDFHNAGFLGKRVTIPGYFGIPTGVVGFVVIVIALLGFKAAEWFERKYGGKE